MAQSRLLVLTCQKAMGYFTERSPGIPPQPNVLSIDVEEWFHVCGLAGEPVVSRREWLVERNIERLLGLLARHNTRATFFVLGSVAETVPTLVGRIAAQGHEIASHGYSHSLVSDLTREGFRDEIRRTHDLLLRQSGQSAVGFRAPQWSLSPARTPWAFEVLREEGYRYDSSCTPLPFVGDRLGKRVPHRLAAGTGTIWEIPPMVTAMPLVNLPTGGGWGFRFFPLGLIDRTVAALNRAGYPAVLYLHPRELDPAGPRLGLSPLRSFAAYGPRRDAAPRVESLLGRHRFTTMRELVNVWESA